MRRTVPSRARLASRIALVLVAVPLALELVVRMALPPVPPVLLLAASSSRLAYVGAAVAMGIALFFSRGVHRAGRFAVEGRSLFVSHGTSTRRIPHRTIDAAAVRPRGSGTVEIHVTNGWIYKLDLGDHERARRLVETLRARSPLPARAGTT